VRAYGQRLADVAAREHFHATAAAHETALPHQVGRDVDTGVESIGQRIEVHDLELLSEGVVESALRHTPVKRHLPALEPALVLEPRARLGALVTPAGGLAVAGPLAAADAFFRMLGALRRTQI
jgi:hypothetical protein